MMNGIGCSGVGWWCAGVLCLAAGVAVAGDGGPRFTPDVEIEEPLELLPIQLEGRWGYADREGRVVVPPMYVWADYFYREFDSTYVDEREDQMTRWMAWRARHIPEGDRTKWLKLESGRTKRGQIQYPTATGMKTGGHPHHSVDRFTRGGYRGQARESGADGRFGICYREQDKNTEAIYDGLLRVSDNLIGFEQAGLCGFLRSDAEVSLPAEFAAVRSFVDGFAAAKAAGGGWGYIDKRGEFVFHDRRGEIEEAKSFSDGMAAIRVGGRWGFIDRSFSPRVRPKYDEVRSFHDGLAAVSRGGVWGYITKTGKETIWDLEAAYDFPDPTRLERNARLDHETVSLASAKQDGLYGYLDKRGRWRIKPRYQGAMPFFRGVARVALGPRSFGYIDARGELIWDPRLTFEHGIQGWDGSGQTTQAQASSSFWPGVSREADKPVEPYPFEFDLDDRLPAVQPFYLATPGDTD